MDCLFCRIIAGEIPCAKIYEDEDIMAFLDIMPVNPGHALVVPKEHCENLADAPEDVLQKIIVAARKIGRAILETEEYDGFNLGVNSGKSAGQLVPHLHFHIMPRKAGDGRELWQGNGYGEGEREEWAEKVRKAIKLIS